MSVAIVTGSAGLVGSEAVDFLSAKGLHVVGIDSDMRQQFFGAQGTTTPNLQRLQRAIPSYEHYDVDVRDEPKLERIWQRYGRQIALVIHCAAQPSHDWAARAPVVDFTINANGTLLLLEATRRAAPDAVFMFASTNKVYGDMPNRLPFVEYETRWEVAGEHAYAEGIPESMPVDGCLHSIFGASKLAADVLVQEYGRYFAMRTACFRCGCLSGPQQAGVELHGFLSYLLKCVVASRPYTIYGYGGKQVRDVLHSADLVRAFWAFFEQPRSGAVYNLGGGRHSNCSVLEAIHIAQSITGRELSYSYREQARTGDHQWWISDLSAFRSHFPQWAPSYTIPQLLAEMAAAESSTQMHRSGI